MPRAKGNPRVRLDRVLGRLSERGVQILVSSDKLMAAANLGLQERTLEVAVVGMQIVQKEAPITLRGVYYRLVSAGVFSSTGDANYDTTGRIMTMLRENGIVSFSSIVDNARSSLKASSWSGISAYVDTVAQAYRKDFWSSLDDYVHVIVEKDAIAGTIQPVTDSYDVTLSPIRGYSSLSFAHAIASEWRQIDKPIHVYYLGDLDPSGVDIEREIQSKLTRYSGKTFRWSRLAINDDDFEPFKVIELDLSKKSKDVRYAKFMRSYTRSAELDALPSDELRRRVEEAIRRHVPQDRWQRLTEVEELEKRQFVSFLRQMPKVHGGLGDNEQN